MLFSYLNHLIIIITIIYILNDKYYIIQNIEWRRISFIFVINLRNLFFKIFSFENRKWKCDNYMQWIIDKRLYYNEANYFWVMPFVTCKESCLSVSNVCQAEHRIWLITNDFLRIAVTRTMDEDIRENIFGNRCSCSHRIYKWS